MGHSRFQKETSQFQKDLTEETQCFAAGVSGHKSLLSCLEACEGPIKLVTDPMDSMLPSVLRRSKQISNL